MFKQIKQITLKQGFEARVVLSVSQSRGPLNVFEQSDGVAWSVV